MPQPIPVRSPWRPSATNRHPANPAPPQSISAGRDASTAVAQAPYRYQIVEPFDPEEFINDDPVFRTHDAAAILGMTADRLMKWRQRGQGPEYLRYEGGDIRYELSALIAFKASRRVRPSRQPHSGKRR